MQRRKIPSNKSRLIGQNFAKFESLKDYLTDLTMIVSDTEQSHESRDIEVLNICLVRSQIENAQNMIHEILGKLSTIELNKTLSKLKGKNND